MPRSDPTLCASVSLAGVPPGQHTMVIKSAHTQDSNAAYATFTINSGYTDFSGVSCTDSGSPNWDLAFCACKIGEDCPSSYS